MIKILYVPAGQYLHFMIDGAGRLTVDFESSSLHIRNGWYPDRLFNSICQEDSLTWAVLCRNNKIPPSTPVREEFEVIYD
jgi:hypothetical protein